jgi:hypothetical protein
LYNWRAGKFPDFLQETFSLPRMADASITEHPTHLHVDLKSDRRRLRSLVPLRRQEFSFSNRSFPMKKKQIEHIVTNLPDNVDA